DDHAGTKPERTGETDKSDGAPKSPGRRRFIAGLGAATAAVSTGVLAPLAAASSASAREARQSIVDSAAPATGLPASVTNGRVVQAFALRVGEATQDALVPPAVNVNN